MLQPSLAEMVQLSQPGLTARVETDAYREKVLKSFMRRGQLVRIPAQLKKRQVILEEIVQAFEPDRSYTEKEVNFILLDFHRFSSRWQHTCHFVRPFWPERSRDAFGSIIGSSQPLAEWAA